MRESEREVGSVVTQISILSTFLFDVETALKNTQTSSSSSCPLYLLLRRFARLNNSGGIIIIIARGAIRRERCPPPPLLLRIHLLVAATGKTSSFV